MAFTSCSSFFSYSVASRPSLPALRSPRARRRCRCSSFSFCNPTQARFSLDKPRSEETTHSPIEPSVQRIGPPMNFMHDEGEYEGSSGTTGNSKLHSILPLPLLAAAALPGAGTVADLFEPIAELVRGLGLPDWLVHWGHPGNMAVVLFAMGGYGSYLGWQIPLSDNMEVKATAKDLHPKLLGGMFFFFTLGATGGILSLLTSGKPIFESPHAVTGLSGLALLSVQTALTGFFESNPSLRSVHGVLGSGIMLLFLLHVVFGLQLGLSY